MKKMIYSVIARSKSSSRSLDQNLISKNILQSFFSGCSSFYPRLWFCGRFIVSYSPSGRRHVKKMIYSVIARSKSSSRSLDQNLISKNILQSFFSGCSSFYPRLWFCGRFIVSYSPSGRRHVKKMIYSVIARSKSSSRSLDQNLISKNILQSFFSGCSSFYPRLWFCGRLLFIVSYSPSGRCHSIKVIYSVIAALVRFGSDLRVNVLV